MEHPVGRQNNQKPQNPKKKTKIMAENELNITLEFSGGAELLFGNKKKHQVTLKSDNQDKCK